MAIPNVLLRLVAKCPEEYFLSKCGKVLDATMSLKDLAEEYREVMEVDKVCEVLSVIANERFENLVEQYPGKFNFQRMRRYIGAIINKKIKNKKAVQLQKYYEHVVAAPDDVEFENPVNLFSYKTVDAVFENGEIVNQSDMVIYIMKDRNNDIVGSVLTNVLGSDKDFHAALLVFATELDHFEVLSYLRSQHAATSIIKDFMVVPLMFKKDPKNFDQVAENVSYALLFGKMTILEPPLIVFYDNILNLNKIVESICPPTLSVSLVSDPGVPIVEIHGQGVNRIVTYYGDNKEISKFKIKLDTDKTPIPLEPEIDDLSLDLDSLEYIPLDDDSSDDIPLVDDSSEHIPLDDYSSDHISLGDDSSVYIPLDDSSENIPSTSTTPAKSSPDKMNDSGFEGDTSQCSSKRIISFQSKMAEIDAEI